MPDAAIRSEVPITEPSADSVVISPLRGLGTSVAQLAYVTLRNAILAMDPYDPEADLRLDEKGVAAQLGVSRTPVREALVRLANEGLVDVLPRRGVRVVRKTKVQIVEMITVWAALESMAARLACERAADEEIATLRELIEKFDGTRIRLRLDEYSVANLRFHQRVIELGRSPLLATMADALLVHVRAIRRHTIGDADRIERSVVDHMEIVEALEARDAARAESLVRDHALNLARHVQRSWMLVP